MQLKEEALFTLKFDGKPVINELGELEKKLVEVKEAQKEVERGTKEWAENKATIKELEASIKQVREEMGVSGMTVQQLRGYYRELNREIEQLTPGTDAYIEKAAQMVEVNELLKQHREATRGVNEEIEKQPTLWERAMETALGYLAAFSVTDVIDTAFSFVQDGITKALALSDMMGTVGKATGQSADEVKGLAAELDKIDTRTTKESLMDIAQIGGQLGVANDELLGFIRSTDMATVALGDEFSGGAEEASSKLGGLQKLFKETEDLKAGESIQKIGSALNELGANGSATAPVIADFTARIGQLGDLAPQITQTMGLGAAFQELGMSAEISAGGLTNILQTASKDTATFAQQIGVTHAEMLTLIRTNPNEFLLKLADSFKNVPIDQVNTRLAALGVNSQEATKVMSLLKDQTDLVRQKQELANKAFGDGTSLQKEFTIMNSTAAAEHEKSQKVLALMATEMGQRLLPAITSVTRGIISFVNIIREVPEFVSENRTSFAALGLAILAFNGHLIVATASSILHSAQQKAQAIWTTSATTAQLYLNAAMTANPIGVIVAALALLVAGLVAIYNNSTTVRGVISGLWEVIKTGVGIVGDITGKVMDWVQKGLEPLRPVLDVVGRALGTVWDALSSGIAFINNVNQALLNFIGNGLGRVSTALAPVRTALSSFWSLIDTGITKIKSIGSAISTFLHVDDLVNTVKSAGGKIGDAFNKGYGDKLAEDRPKQLAAHDAHLDKKKGAETKNATDLATIVTSTDQKSLDKKAAQADNHRQEQAKRAADAAKKEADEAIKASTEGLKQIETLRIDSIKNDLDREIATIRAKRDAQVEALASSKASIEVKAVWEKALNEKMVRDVADAQEKARLKNESEEAAATRRTLDLKIKLAGDEKADKLQKLEDVAIAQRAQVAKDVQDETQKAALLKQINDTLIAGKERVEQEYRRKNQAETKALQDAQYQATVADADARLLLAGDNAGKIYQAKKDKLDAEYQYNKAKLEREALEEKAKNQELIQDQERRAQADKATDDKLKAQLTANDVKYENDKTTLSADKTAARKKNQEEYFSAIKGLMNGDFTQFTDLLTKKLSGEKKQLTDAQKANVDKIDTVGGYAVMGVQALTALNAAALNKELGNITKERTTALASWKDKYSKGLINKEEYEKGVDSINKEADAKEKQAKLESFKRQQKLDIIMAVINGVQAALKSLAMMGWPFGLIGAAGAAVAAGIQIAIIKRQQPPAMKQGGTIRNAGVPDGPSHGRSYGDSGLAITRRDTGEEVAEMEGGEPVMVLSRNTYSNNRRVVDSLLHSSLHRNGAAVMREGGIMFDDGGYMVGDNSGSSDSGSGEAAPDSGGGGTGGGSNWMNQANDTAEEMDSSSYQAEVDKSTALMEAIGKNTLATVDALGKLASLIDQQGVAQNAGLRDLGSALAGSIDELGVDFRTALPTMGTEIGEKLTVTNSLLTRLSADTTMFGADAQEAAANLVTMMLAELADLQQMLTSQALALRSDLVEMKLLAHDDVKSLQQSVHVDLVDSQSGTGQVLTSLRTDLREQATALQAMLASMTLSEHLDLMDVKQTVHADQMAFQTNLSGWLDVFQTNLFMMMTTACTSLERELTAWQTSAHQEFLDGEQQAEQRGQVMQRNLSTFFDATSRLLESQFTQLRQVTHGDLTALTDTTRLELRGVQGRLDSSNREQQGQTGLLGAIARKDLSVSVQTFVNVFNQIEVVADKSNLK